MPSMCAAADHHSILDSGASVHATGDRRVLELDHPADNAEVTTAEFEEICYYRRRDGNVLPVVGTGRITSSKAAGDFDITGVQYVPELGPGFTLVSVQQLATSGFLVMFCGGVCYVADVNKGGSIVGKGLLHDDDGFYHLQFLRVPALDVVHFQEETTTGSAVA